MYEDNMDPLALALLRHRGVTAANAAPIMNQGLGMAQPPNQGLGIPMPTAWQANMTSRPIQTRPIQRFGFGGFSGMGGNRTG